MKISKMLLFVVVGFALTSMFFSCGPNEKTGWALVVENNTNQQIFIWAGIGINSTAFELGPVDPGETYSFAPTLNYNTGYHLRARDETGNVLIADIFVTVTDRPEYVWVID